MTDTLRLMELGYSERWRALFEPHAAEGLAPARVARCDRGGSLLATATGVVRAMPSARLRKSAREPGDLPVVGDWVAATEADDPGTAQIHAVLERASAMRRRDPGRTSAEQVLVANVDFVFVAHPIADRPNLRRVERELALAWESGAQPVVILTKADLSPDPDGARAETASIAIGVDVLAVSALDGARIESLLTYVRPHRTAVLIGPSGAGKSTLINALLGQQRLATSEVRMSDGRGRHTTVARELIVMPGGGVLIDTPGLRELGLTGSEDGIASVFPDIERAARSCRFRDCAHGGEPDCAVLAAVQSGQIPAERLESYRKLVREAQLAEARTDARLRAGERRREKTFSKVIRDFNRRRGHD